MLPPYFTSPYFCFYTTWANRNYKFSHFCVSFLNIHFSFWKYFKAFDSKFLLTYISTPGYERTTTSCSTHWQTARPLHPWAHTATAMQDFRHHCYWSVAVKQTQLEPSWLRFGASCSSVYMKLVSIIWTT